MRVETAKLKVTVGLGALLAMAGCSGGADGSSCSVVEADGGGALIECADGTSVQVPPGAAGMDGASGDSCTVTDGADGGALVECEDGSSVRVPPGQPGPEGPPGPGGDAGPPGTGGGFGVAGAGVKVSIDSVTIPEDRHPVATLLITDGDGVGLDASNVLSAGEVAFRFTFVHVPDNAEFDGPGNYVNYILRGNGQPGDERGTGEWTLVDPATGAHEYRFELELPEDYDPSETHAISVLAERTVDELTLLDHDFHGFVPNDASAEPRLRETSNDATCNSCHTRLTVHGDHRSGYQVCLTCHTQEAVDPDTGNSIAFADMLHKVHIGADLPSNDPDNNADPGSWGRGSEDYYKMIGFSSRRIFFDEVHFPQDIGNCAACHTGPDAEWVNTRPSEFACGSCHDRTWFGTVASMPDGWMAHTGGPKDGSTPCTSCHTFESETNYFACGPAVGGTLSYGGSDRCDAWVRHYNQYTEPAAPNFTVDMLEVDVVDADTTPVEIHFRARIGTNEDGPLRDATLAELEDVRIMVAGPNEDYANTGRVQFDDDSDPADDEITLVDEGGGMFTATLFTTDPAAGPLTWNEIVAAIGAGADPAVDSFTFSLRAGTTLNEDGAAAPEIPAAPEFKAFTINPTVAVKLTPATEMDPLVTRREVVEDARCNTCHEDLRYSYHRGAYRSVKQCNMCHAPVIDRPTQRPRRRLGVMLHDIHGMQYDPDGQPHTGYPGDARNCEQCHLSEATWDLALPAGVLPTKEISGAFTPPVTSFCTGCHNAPDTLAHAQLSTIGSFDEDLDTNGTESCSNCHGIGQTFGVDVVHAFPSDE